MEQNLPGTMEQNVWNGSLTNSYLLGGGVFLWTTLFSASVSFSPSILCKNIDG